MTDEQKPDQLREHNFDGIQEYDNQLPRWWVWKFVLTVVFAVGYLYFFEISGRGRGLIETHEDEVKQIQISKLLTTEADPFLGESELRNFLSDQT